MNSYKRKMGEEGLTQVLDGLEEAVHIVDPEGKTILYNRAASLLDGLASEEVMGLYILDVFPSLTPKTSTLLNVLETGQPVHEQQQSYTNRKGKKIITVNKTFPLMQGGVLQGAVEVAKDITSVKALSDQVIDLRQQMNRSHGKKKAYCSHIYAFSDIVTKCPLMLREIERARRASKTLSPVLVVGETGTGKELIVQSIHHASIRGDKAFVAQNCAAIPTALLEGILFGTVKGAFTGAEDRPGLFELAHGGTLFLDEIQAMPMELQAKLLRVLEEGAIRRVGAVKVHPVDVRIIVATNEDPMESMREGRLRKDLFYRIHVMGIYLPPLRERRGDIPLLMQYFHHQLQEQAPYAIASISDEVTRVFTQYEWPGNVRELKHSLEGAIHIAQETELKVEDLPVYMKGVQAKVPVLITSKEMCLKDQLQEVERTLIQQAMGSTHGNVMKAAQRLGIPRQTLQYKLKKMKM